MVATVECMREQPTVPNRARPIRPLQTRIEPPPTVRQRVPHQVRNQQPPKQGRPAPVPPVRSAEPPTLQAPAPEPEAPRPPLPPVRPWALPLLLPALGGVWWAVGSAALATGAGTLVLALGLSVAVALGVALHRRFGRGSALPAGGRIRLIKVGAAAVAGVLLGGAGLRLLGLGEIAVPLACGIVAFALFAMVRVVDERLYVGLAGALLVLAAIGAVTAMSTPGILYPQGLVGMGAGILCWAVAAVRGGLIAEIWARRRG